MEYLGIGHIKGGLSDFLLENKSFRKEVCEKINLKIEI